MIYTEDQSSLNDPSQRPAIGDIPVSKFFEFLSIPIVTENLLCTLSILLQYFAIYFLHNAHNVVDKEVSKLLMLTSVAFFIRGLTILSSAIAVMFIPTDTWWNSVICQVVLHIDYCITNLSVLLIFLISLDRFIRIKYPVMYKKIFEKTSIFVLFLFFCLLLSFGSGILSIWTSNIEGAYIKHIGYVAKGKEGGYSVLLSCLFVVFPFLSAILYSITFHHLHKLKINPTPFVPKASFPNKKRVFGYVFTTAILYLIISAIKGIIYFFDLANKGGIQCIYLGILNVCNNLPDIAFPIFLLLKHFEVWTKIKDKVAKRDRAKVGETQIWNVVSRVKPQPPPIVQ